MSASSSNLGPKTILTVLQDSTIKEDLRLKAAQELAETFESNVNSSGYPAFLDTAMKAFIKVLQEGESHFFSEFNVQQVSALLITISVFNLCSFL